ncbi:neprilysin-21-like [Belonocnema kinseyi]|uniref:neprilysin-21-like n=1 Tax=Belonocnema kinseyi TaxID=2817044 RepID=UPI00143DDC88|nr:neprilysin-21-like [Belonocnema kinseyi]
MLNVERSDQSGTWICCVPCFWLRRSKAVHKALLTFAMLLVTSLLVTSPVLFLITTLPEGEQPLDCAPLDDACIRERDGPEGICETKACYEASLKMLASMKRGVDPCKDFYQFACGGYRDRQPYQPSASFGTLQAQVDQKIKQMLTNKTGKMTGVFTKVGRFYESCLEFGEKPVDFNPVLQLLNNLGGYLSSSSSVPEDVTPLVAALLKLNGAPLFDLYIDTDLQDSTKSAVFLDLPTGYQVNSFFQQNLDSVSRQVEGFSLDESRSKRSTSAESKAYTVIKNNKEEARAYKIKKLIERLIPDDMDPKERSLEADQLIQFCLALHKIYPRHKDLYNWMDIDHRIYVRYNLSFLQENFDYVRWGILVNATIGNTTADQSNRNRADYDAGYEEENINYVYVTAPRYFRSLGKLLNRFPKRVIHNGLLLLYASDTLYDVVNVTASENWNTSCYHLTKNIFSDAVSALYVQQYKPQFLETLANRVASLFERVKETLATRMLVMSWLDDETRTEALLKLRTLRGKFHVWSGFYNETLLARRMAEVVIDPENFFVSLLQRFQQIRTLDGQRSRRNTSQKWQHHYSVNAYYESWTNSIVIPLPMMAAWSWSWEGGPAYSSYATLGSVIAHEILHAFDLHHRRLPLDPDLDVSLGNERWIWITPEAWRKLEARIECVANLYARSFWRKVKFYGSSVDVQFDWNVTRNENVADVGALQISYQTWHSLTNGKDRSLPGLEALRPSQLFFISAAQTYCSNMTAEAYILSVELDYHTPQPERVNGIMMNSLAFSEAFRCPAGAKMNPPKKCTTW